MKFPKNLTKDGCIGFVAPSFGCNTEPYKSAFENALKNFSDMGYETKLGPNCYAGEGIGISNTPKKCAEELMDFYADTDSHVLISCGGGELMCEVLSYMDFGRIKEADPKWFMGFSDNTNFTFLLATLCDTAAIYGPCAAAYGMEPWHPSLRDAVGLLTGSVETVKGYDGWERSSLKCEEMPLAPYNITEERKIVSYVGREKIDWAKTDNVGRNGEIVVDNAGPEGADAAMEPLTFSGRLLGGCMDCLVNLLGTRFDETKAFAEKYKEDGILWFLEACDLNVFGIRRAMWQMKEAGWFAHVKGFLIGRPLCFGQESMGLDAYSAILEVAGELGVPVIFDVDLGHLSPMMPLIVGSFATVKVQGNEIEVRMEKR